MDDTRGGGRHGPPPRWLTTLLLAAALQLPPWPSAAQPALADCRAIADDRGRLACYDAVAERAGQAGGAPPSAEELFGRDPRESEALARAAAGIGATTAIEARVSRVDRDALGKLAIGLDNGQSWKQLDSTPLPLKPGVAVRIRRAALDSYLLTLRDGSTSIRVRRTQ